MCSAKRRIRFTPKSGHVRCKEGCPLRANSGHPPKKEEAAWGQAASKRTSRLGTGNCPAKSLRHICCVQSQSASFLVQTPLNEGALVISKVGLQKPFVSLDVLIGEQKERTGPFATSLFAVALDKLHEAANKP